MDDDKLEQGAGDAGQNGGMDAGAGDKAGAGTDNGADKEKSGESSAGKDKPSGKSATKQAGKNDKPSADGEGDADGKNTADEADKPITDWSKVTLDLPEGAEIDETVLGSFGKAVVELGLTPKQASALANWQLDAIAAQREALMESGVKELNKAWGAKGEANQKSVLGLISRIDRALGDESFSTALGRSGATCFPGVVKGLLAVAGLLSEDSMGGGGAAAQAEHEETALEGLENALKDARRSGK